MCIVFLINALRIGGAERVFVDDANYLSSKGYKVHVVTLFDAGPLAKELSNDVQVQELGAHGSFDPKALRAFLRIVPAHPCIVITTLNEANVFGRVAALFSPNIILYTREANMADRKSLRYKLFDWLFGWRSNRIIAVSKAVAHSLGTYAPWLLNRVTVLYNGAPHFDTPRARDTAAYTRILAVGSLTAKKDHALLIRALACLPEMYTLTIVGDGLVETSLRGLYGSFLLRPGFL